MDASKISIVLDLARKCREADDDFIPLFIGEAGVGKSQVVQQWVATQQVKEPDFGFIDLRIAYFEAPDLIGLPKEVLIEKLHRILYSLPSFWPTKGNGLLLLEEPNRAPTSVMNCLMQILTDRKVNDYCLPKGWMIAACTNPTTADYDTNAMCLALANRFVPYDIEYNHNVFVEYIEKMKWDERVINFIKSSQWVYKKAGQLAKNAVYISPRTFSDLNTIMKNGGCSDREMHNIHCTSVLGKDIGNIFWKSCWDESPLLAKDFLENEELALATLKKQCQHDKFSTYKGDRVAVTVQSIIDNYGGREDIGECKPGQISERLMGEISMIIPKDQTVAMLSGCGAKIQKEDITKFIKDFAARNPHIIKSMKAVIKVSQITKDHLINERGEDDKMDSDGNRVDKDGNRIDEEGNKVFH